MDEYGINPINYYNRSFNKLSFLRLLAYSCLKIMFKLLVRNAVFYNGIMHVKLFYFVITCNTRLFIIFYPL